jgi:hypothetical protein
MGFITDWNGNVIQSPTPESLWSNKGGIFTPAGRYVTYFPLPSAYRTAIPIVGTYIIPAYFENRADLIANALYASEDYWWLVYWFNGILDPFASLTAGTEILVADIVSVNNNLG